MKTTPHLATELLLQVQTALHDVLIIGAVKAARQGELLPGLHRNEEPFHVGGVAAKLKTGHSKVIDILKFAALPDHKLNCYIKTPEQVRGSFTGGNKCEWLPQTSARLHRD